jgi:hypothetical protein
VIVSDHLLHIIDFKYGKGVRVEAQNNPQMKLYAVGALEMFGSLYNVDEVETQSFNLAWPISVPGPLMQKLMHWANTELKEKAELAFAGQRYRPLWSLVPILFLQCVYCELVLTIITSSPASSYDHPTCSPTRKLLKY